jgi:hypothetical protein
MAFFNELYEAAFVQNDEAIKTLLSKGACLDEREYNKQYLTVAGKLAFEGHIKQAMHLINR